MLLDKVALQKELGVSRATLDRIRASNPLFPQPVRLTGPTGHPRWDAGEVEEFKRRMLAARTPAPAAGAEGVAASA